MKREIAIDVDGVLADFHSKARDKIEELFGYKLPIDALHTWDVTHILERVEERVALNRAIAEPGFAASLKPFKEALEIIPKLMKKATVYFATSPNNDSPTWMKERENWLLHHFNADPKQIIQIHDKQLLSVDIFVDDKPDNVRAWRRRQHGRAFLADTLYNRDATDLDRIISLNELYKYI